MEAVKTRSEGRQAGLIDRLVNYSRSNQAIVAQTCCAIFSDTDNASTSLRSKRSKNMNDFIAIAAIVAVLVLFILVILASRLLGHSPQDDRSSYTVKHYLGSKAERSFFGVLSSAVGTEYIVAPKVRVADALAPRKGLSRSDWQSAFNRISAKHFDFVICHASTLRIAAAVELDDKSHDREDRRERDDFLDAAARKAGLPLLRFNAKSGYSQAQIRDLFADAIGQSQRVPEEDSLGRKDPVVSWNVD